MLASSIPPPLRFSLARPASALGSPEPVGVLRGVRVALSACIHALAATRENRLRQSEGLTRSFRATTTKVRQKQPQNSITIWPPASSPAPSVLVANLARSEEINLSDSDDSVESANDILISGREGEDNASLPFQGNRAFSLEQTRSPSNISVHG